MTTSTPTAERRKLVVVGDGACGKVRTRRIASKILTILTRPASSPSSAKGLSLRYAHRLRNSVFEPALIYRVPGLRPHMLRILGGRCRRREYKSNRGAAQEEYDRLRPLS
jgi:hypothetical protein